MSDLTAFESLLRDGGVRLPSIWQAVFEETQEQLFAACPEGVDLLDVCRAAFDSLPEAARGEAMDALFYGWWENFQDRKAREAWGGAS
ncbi:hypothetical protein ACFC08_18065 [Streptomyces sp. NPDC056112]|uniref:hypothetical protein n=1 Tax=Streptomyces sp. NPDC056112 TaxID=3345715 RepID=UPI0035DF764D